MYRGYLGVIIKTIGLVNVHNVGTLYAKLKRVKAESREEKPVVEKRSRILWTPEEKGALLGMKPITTRSLSAIRARIHWAGRLDSENQYYFNKEQRAVYQDFYSTWFRLQKLQEMK